MADDDANMNEKHHHNNAAAAATDGDTSTVGNDSVHDKLSTTDGSLNEKTHLHNDNNEHLQPPATTPTTKRSDSTGSAPSITLEPPNPTSPNHLSPSPNGRKSLGNRVSLDVPQSPPPRHSLNDPTSPPPRLRRSMSTVMSAFAPLPFHIRDHKLAVSIIIAIVVIDHGLLPPVLYFGLKYGTTMKDQTIMAIVTSIFGVIFGLDTIWRLYKLWRKDGAYRPGPWRWGVDFFQVSFCTVLIINVSYIIAGTAIDPPLMRILALPMPLLIFQFSWQLLLSQLLRRHNFRTPFRQSSVEKGEKWPLVLYLLVEDVIAVDANGTNDWRHKWKKRYETSRDMRVLVEKLSLFWGVGGIICSAVCVAFVFAIDGHTGKEVGYAIGWLAPWLWVFPSAVITVVWVKKALKKEADYYFQEADC